MQVFRTGSPKAPVFCGSAVMAMALALTAPGAGLELPSCLVSIEAEPQNAEVLIDWKPVLEWPGAVAAGQGKWTLRLAPGDYVAHFGAPLHEPTTAELHIREGDANALLARSLEKTTGLALLKSDPPGADITIGGVSFGTAPRLVTDLPLGTWQATFSLPGCKEQTVQFTLKDRVPVQALARLSTDTATLVVTSNVEGAEIRVNGAIRGTAPCTVGRVPAGEIVIEARAPGYRDYVQRSRVGEAERLEVVARLEPLPASIAIHSLPGGARVYLDNSYRGETPMVIDDLAHGTHRLRVEKDGFDPMARTVALKLGENATEEFRLKSNTGMLSVTSVPAGVSVYVDGAKMGETPAGDVKDLSGVLEIGGIAEGTHKLEFVKPGFYKQDAECKVKRGETVIRRVELKRRFIPNYAVDTETGRHTGVFVTETATEIKLETRPGITTTYKKGSILGHGPLKE